MFIDAISEHEGVCMPYHTWIPDSISTMSDTKLCIWMINSHEIGKNSPLRNSNQVIFLFMLLCVYKR